MHLRANDESGCLRLTAAAMPVIPKRLMILGARLATARTALRLRQKTSALRAQRRMFRRLMRGFAKTTYGQEAGITGGISYEVFRELVPLQTYGQLVPFIARMKQGEKNVLWPGRCAFYAVTPGTTDEPPKSLPVTFDLLAHFHRAAREALQYYCVRTGNYRVLEGRHLMLGGSTALTLVTETDTFAAYEGDISALTALNLPPSVERHFFEPGNDIAQMTDWPAKIAAIAQRTQPLDITLVAGIPSWLLVLAEALRPGGSRGQSRPPTLQQTYWPKLECVIHGGVPIGPFHGELRRAFGANVHFQEVYPTSEGFIAAQDATAIEGLRLMADDGLFFEFLPVQDFTPEDLGKAAMKTLPLAEVKANEDYALILTTPGGLCRYVLGDVVRFVSTVPPRLIYVGRLGLQLNAFGENVIEKELTDSLLAVCSPHGWSITNFHVAPLGSDSHLSSNRGRHEWWIELRPGTALTPTGPALAEQLDAELKVRNASYAAKRRGLELEPPVARLVMPGVFEHWMRHHGKWGGQNKMPRCRSDRRIADELMQLARFNA